MTTKRISFSLLLIVFFCCVLWTTRHWSFGYATTFAHARVVANIITFTDHSFSYSNPNFYLDFSISKNIADGATSYRRKWLYIASSQIGIPNWCASRRSRSIIRENSATRSLAGNNRSSRTGQDLEHGASQRS